MALPQRQRLRRRFRFEAAHRLPNHPGKCRNLHGHGYLLEVTIEGRPAEPSGMVMDFADLEAVVQRAALERLDHRDLNDLLPNPTAENLAAWIWRALEEAGLALVALRLQETADCDVVLEAPGGGTP